MDRDAFTRTLAEAAGIDAEAPERAIRATLTTLGEKISEGEGRKEFQDMLSQLPHGLRERLVPSSTAGPGKQPAGRTP